MNEINQGKTQESDEEEDDLFEILGLDRNETEQVPRPKKKIIKKRNRGNQLVI